MSRQSADRKRAKIRRWVVALVLAVGLGVAWGVVLGVGGSIIMALVPSNPVAFESIVVANDGTPLIRTPVAGNYNNSAELRTLDGQTVELDQERRLNGASLGEPYREPGVLQLPISWRERVAGCSDFAKPPTNWILLRNDRRPGSAYFAGYDILSKLCVGYIGRRGLRSTIPPADEQFDLGNQTFSWGSGVATSAAYINYGGPPNHYGATKPVDGQYLATWIVFLLDGNVIQEIDLRNHTVRPLEKIDGLYAIGVVQQPASVDGETDKEIDTDQQASRVQTKFRLAATHYWTVLSVAGPVGTKVKTTVHRLLARCTDRIVAINPFDGSLKEFPLPQELRQKSLSAYSVAEDQLLLQVGLGAWEHGSIQNLLWINSAGEVTREETLRLAGHTPGDPRVAALGIAALAPSLLPWAVGSTMLVAVQQHQAENYVAGFSKMLSYCWPALLLILGLSIAFTLLVRHWQKKFCRDNTLLWCATVFALTVPGLLAYWIMHRGTVIEPCSECGQPAPRDRDACPHCEKPFAAPPLLGTEILVTAT